MAIKKPESKFTMQQTLTLISSLKNACISEDLVQKIADDIGANSSWLYSNVACDLLLPKGVVNEHVREKANVHIANLPIDVVIQPSRNRRKKIFLADMDSTIIGQECIDELAAEIGVKDEVSRITEAAMNGEIDFEGALKDRVALLKGLSETIVSGVLQKRITINDGAKEALAVMRHNHTHTALVSGGFTVFASEIARETGFHEFHANTLLSKDGKFTGKVKMPILGQQAKLDQLNRLSTEKNVAIGDTIAIGDGANDLPMLLNASTGIAFHAKPSVAAKANIIINHGDLSAILFVQGYSKKDIDTAIA